MRVWENENMRISRHGITGKMEGERDRMSPCKTHDFCYQYRSNGATYRLRVPLEFPYKGNAKELTLRVIRAHDIPCYLEEDICAKLGEFVREVSEKTSDAVAEESLFGGSVFEKGSETEQTIGQWVDSFAENHVQFSTIRESTDSETKFADAYHTLIHSSTLETILQLEHTYSIVVSEVCKAWDSARDTLHKRLEAELSEAMKNLGVTKTEKDINILMRHHTHEREACEAQWANELAHRQEAQWREYREWVMSVYKDKDSETTVSQKKSRRHKDSDCNRPEDFDQNVTPPLEESFTIHLGAQRKMTHNIRLLCGNPLDLCRHKTTTMRGVVVPHPERLQTAMSLYSPKLSALVLMVDGRVSLLGGLKEAFASVCHQSTDFHFSDIDVQVRKVREFASTVSQERREQKLTASFEGLSASAISRSESSSDVIEKSSLSSTESSSQFLPPPDHLSPPSNSRLSPVSSGGGGWTGGRVSPLLDSGSGSVSLESGDFYITRHSNLSQVHVVFHLVMDEVSVQSSSLRARNPVIVGLKNCLRAAARHDIHHVTIPLLLVHRMQPEMTISWCLKRAELVFKCVKGFMLENTAWGGSGSRTVQFLIPIGISEAAFEEFCEMLPKIFRVASTRNLTTRSRGHSFK